MTTPSTRKSAPLDNNKPIGLRLTPDERVDAFAYAEREDRSASNFVRCVYLMGLSIYRERGIVLSDKTPDQS